MTHKDVISWLYNDKLNVLSDVMARKFTHYIHRSFYNIPFMVVLIDEYINTKETYNKPSRMLEFYKYLLNNNNIPQSKLTNIFPKKKTKNRRK